MSKSVQIDSDQRNLHVFDATCPLVSKVHAEVQMYSKISRECILIGHANHPEVEGTMGQYNVSLGGRIYLVESLSDAQTIEVKNPDDLAYVTQTTLSIDDTEKIIKALKSRFPKMKDREKMIFVMLLKIDKIPLSS